MNMKIQWHTIVYNSNLKKKFYGSSWLLASSKPLLLRDFISVINWISVGNVFLRWQSIMERAGCPDLDPQWGILHLPFIFAALFPHKKKLQSQFIQKLKCCIVNIHICLLSVFFPASVDTLPHFLVPPNTISGVPWNYQCDCVTCQLQAPNTTERVYILKGIVSHSNPILSNPLTNEHRTGERGIDTPQHNCIVKTGEVARCWGTTLEKKWLGDDEEKH